MVQKLGKVKRNLYVRRKRESGTFAKKYSFPRRNKKSLGTMLLYLVWRETFPNHLTWGQGKFPKQKAIVVLQNLLGGSLTLTLLRESFQCVDSRKVFPH